VKRLVAEESLARLLRVIPVVSEMPDGMSVSEIVERFDYPRPQLLKDFKEVVPFVGVEPFTPDVMVWAEVRDDRLYVEMPHWFSQPMRLPSDEAARVFALCKAALEISGEADADTPGPLLSAFLKLGDELGAAAATAVDVELGAVLPDTLETLRSAIAQKRRVELNYFSSSSGERSLRLVDPRQAFSVGGFWYLSGWCHLSCEERPFRLDRVLDAQITGETFDSGDHEPADPADPSAFASGDDKPRAVIRVDGQVRWMLEVGFPVEEIVEIDGGVEATLVVAAVPWLARLLLRLGPHAEIVRLDPGLPAGLRSEAAARLLERYR